MLSRRNIRVKVMQTLYSLESLNNEVPKDEPQKMFQKKLENSQQLITYLTYYIIEIARYSEKDAVKKASKHRPTESDLNVSTKIAGNEIVWAALENSSWKRSADKFKTKYLVDEEIVRKLYLDLVKTEEYQEYIALQARNKKSEKRIVEFILSDIMLGSEIFLSDAEEKFIHWDDDAEMVILLMSTFFQKPSQFDFFELTGPEKLEFGQSLLQAVLDKDEYCLEIIRPKLKNWDSERIAALDMIFLKMGVCELLYFETIPPKVTINEYIDLAKEYSTEQSGFFINGILDNIHKELVGKNLIHKTDYKNSTL